MIFMEENKNIWVWALAVGVLFFLFGSLGMGSYGMMGFGMGFGFPFMLLFWGVLIWMVVTLINSSQSGRKEEDALIILKKRYASGKISKKQYDKMKKEIR